MTDDEAKTMLEQLERHYHAPLLTPKQFCDKLYAWLEVSEDYLVARGYLFDRDNIQSMFLAASKSDLLGRLLYGGENVRTEPCPVCKGSWRGCFQNCPCGGCGWLPNK